MKHILSLELVLVTTKGKTAQNHVPGSLKSKKDLYLLCGFKLPYIFKISNVIFATKK